MFTVGIAKDRLRSLYRQGFLYRRFLLIESEKNPKKRYRTYYRLSKKALDYRKEYGSFLNPEGYLMRRALGRYNSLKKKYPAI